jgi:hypothetical protein
VTNEVLKRPTGFSNAQDPCCKLNYNDNDGEEEFQSGDAGEIFYGHQSLLGDDDRL